MDRSFLANTVLALMIALTSWSLWSLGEHRIDAYLALYALEYTVVKAILRPRRRGIDWLFVALIAVFFLCVGYRIYEVLTH